MRRAKRKHNLFKYKFLFFQTAIGILLLLMYVFANAPDLLILIHQAKVFPLLKTFLGILIAYVVGPLLVIYLTRRAVLEHKGIISVNWRTYLNDSLYNDFCSQPSDIEPDDMDYWKTQEIIARKKAENGNGFDYAFNRKEANPEMVYSMRDDTEPLESLADVVPETDPLEGLPDYDPNGPNPFARG